MLNKKKRLANGEIPIKEVKCGCPLKGTHIYFLKQMMERQLISDQDCALIKSTCPLSALQKVNQRTVILSYND